MSAAKIFNPGSTIGILGSGQLGRMLALAARSMGYRVAVYSPERNSPAGVIADLEVAAAYEDLDQVRKFACEVDVITFEFENVPFATTAAAAEFAVVRPEGSVLHTTQNRLREKNFLKQHGFPTTGFAQVQTLEDLLQAVDSLGLPGVLKTADFGYDGKGQVKIRSREEAGAAIASMKGQIAIYEAFVDFVCELSVVAARTVSGEFSAFPVFQNEHRNHILDVTFAPADLPAATKEAAVEIARGILEKLSVVGLLTVEMFLTRDGRVLVNELAPRTHNSGHLTIDACSTSQFEQQVRAVCGLPLGSTELLRPAAMANLLGDVWSSGEPRWSQALRDPAVTLHLYGKSEPRPGRKMGHITVLGATPQQAIDAARGARQRLVNNSVGN
jgi:5-(carboxyamino)imidazole ribonucleotide synthase